MNVLARFWAWCTGVTPVTLLHCRDCADVGKVTVLGSIPGTIPAITVSWDLCERHRAQRSGMKLEPLKAVG